MEKTINLVIVETKEKIIQALIESNLPIVITSMILNEVSTMVNTQANDVIKREQQAFEEASKMPSDPVNKSTLKDIKP